MNPTLKTELDALIARIEKHRAALRLSPAKFVARYQRYLGSVRSYEDRILTRSFDRLNTDKLLAKLRQFVAELDGGTSVQTVYQDLPVLSKLWTLYEMLQGQTTDRRCLVFVGVTGCGKTVGMRAICNDPDTAGDTAFVKCLPRMERSPLALALAVCTAIGCESSGSFTECVANIGGSLRAAPKTVMFDDGHYGGTLLMALIKCWIDETPSRFIYATYPTDFFALQTATLRGAAESQQLLGRCLKPKFDEYKDGIGLRDAAKFLRRAAGLDKDAESTARAVLDLCRRNGNLRLLADAVENVAISADDAGDEITGRDIIEEVRALCGLQTQGAAESGGLPSLVSGRSPQEATR
ncbi:MAG: hypothetical protein NTY01_08805 [Verrucomicrobia bacterium]|nr:hypothetical protein [Verrucomicrobiota bacterium]